MDLAQWQLLHGAQFQAALQASKITTCSGAPASPNVLQQLYENPYACYAALGRAQAATVQKAHEAAVLAQKQQEELLARQQRQQEQQKQHDILIASAQQKPCWNYAKGKCHRNPCSFYHDPFVTPVPLVNMNIPRVTPKRPQPACNDYARGVCRRGGKCHYSHSHPQGRPQYPPPAAPNMLPQYQAANPNIPMFG